MKKALLVAAVLLGTSTLFAQNDPGANQHLIHKAKKAAIEAGCLSDYSGQVDAQVTVISSCFAGGFVTEVLLVPHCTGPDCDAVKLAPLARVTFYCTEENPSVECL